MALAQRTLLMLFFTVSCLVFMMLLMEPYERLLLPRGDRGSLVAGFAAVLDFAVVAWPL
jgi:hypothetical protein